MKNVNKFDLS